METTEEKHTTFTPGPWYAHGTRVSTWETQDEIDFHGDEVIAETGFKANARLIAAAPAMYEVLQELAESMELAKNYGYEKEHAMIQEVLAKVEGGEG